ncbi:glutamate synthase [Lachnoclostridium edouardi]|uniref:GltB/FmdC/FwdC-like GXGXG domain-containing protein n=1 Tax=Lachnoclostridium edouardi TaxID=1926283 RepID=UPI000C7B7B8B|nr:glutamate synthase [Lachnoclostridium edouardi]
MMILDAKQMDYQLLNTKIRESEENVSIKNCLGQRFIAAGLRDKEINITGTPGNALGAYLNGANITVFGNAQDAVGDTMNEGNIIIHGNIGDAAGYAMRGGHIYVKGNAGYRAGIHMKEYKEKRPVMIIGGVCGSFLGEYQAGGIIIALGIDSDGKEIVSNFPCTGMHGGKMFLRSNCKNIHFPDNVSVRTATNEDLSEIREYISSFCTAFEYDADTIMDACFTIITPDSKNPYKQMYVAN